MMKGNLATEITMKVILAKYAGFCPGMKQARKKPPPMTIGGSFLSKPKETPPFHGRGGFILSELIHNPKPLKS